MKSVWIVLVVVMLMSVSNIFAADGDLIVNGNLGVGTAAPQSKLDVNGNISVTIDGKAFTLKYVNGNLGEDVYGQWVVTNITATASAPIDTCDGQILLQYTCPVNVSKSCSDTFFIYGQSFEYRTVRCSIPLVFLEQ
jgi:hypothetical protein